MLMTWRPIFILNNEYSFFNLRFPRLHELQLISLQNNSAFRIPRCTERTCDPRFRRTSDNAADGCRHRLRQDQEVPSQTGIESGLVSLGKIGLDKRRFRLISSLKILPHYEFSDKRLNKKQTNVFQLSLKNNTIQFTF
jgi:hypothetical protein